MRESERDEINFNMRARKHSYVYACVCVFACSLACMCKCDWDWAMSDHCQYTGCCCFFKLACCSLYPLADLLVVVVVIVIIDCCCCCLALFCRCPNVFLHISLLLLVSKRVLCVECALPFAVAVSVVCCCSSQAGKPRSEWANGYGFQVS